MCYAYIFNDVFSIIERYQLNIPKENLENFRRINKVIRPTSFAPVIVNNSDNNRTLKFMRFGLIPNWAKDNKFEVNMCNARVETLDSKPAYKVPFKHKRCIIPANGFYEYKKEKVKSYPYLFTNNDNNISFAGIYDTWINAKNENVNTFSIITTKANKVIEKVHDRMPLQLTSDIENDWLSNNIFDKDKLKNLIDYNNSLLELKNIPITT